MKGFTKTYRCVNCNREINPMRQHYCPYCNYEQPLEKRADALGDTIVDIKCPKCGFEKSFFRSNDYLDTAYCPRCGESTYLNEEGKKPVQPVYDPSSVECPYCHTKNTRKISKLSKAGSAALFGVFALGKVTKQWHCNNCGSDF